MTLTVTVTVGRNIGTVPLSADNWESLQRRIRVALAYATTGTGETETHFGVGTWEGVTEKSAKITRYGTEWSKYTGLVWLRSELGEIARIYRQDAISLVTGEGEIIAPLAI